MALLIKLNKDNDVKSIELIKTFVENDTPSIKKSFEIMTKNTPIADFFGVNKMADLGNDKKD